MRPGAEKEALVREIAQKLEQVKDPQTGERIISRAFVTKDVYQGRYVEEAPEIIVGYNRGYRASWSTPLGRVPKNLVEDNKEKWSGDHCMDPNVIPGILLVNRKSKVEYPALYDLTATILDVYNIEKPKEMIGKSIF